MYTVLEEFTRDNLQPPYQAKLIKAYMYTLDDCLTLEYVFSKCTAWFCADEKKLRLIWANNINY